MNVSNPPPSSGSPSVRRTGRIGALVLGGALATSCAAGQKGYAPVNGVDLYYEVHGPAGDSGTPLVLLHGGGSTFETSFADILPALSRGRRVIVYDRQGHGRTADVDRPFSFRQSADDAVGLLRTLGVTQADFMGFSNGGQIALQIALSHPEIVRKLVVESAMSVVREQTRRSGRGSTTRGSRTCRPSSRRSTCGSLRARATSPRCSGRA